MQKGESENLYKTDAAAAVIVVVAVAGLAMRVVVSPDVMSIMKSCFSLPMCVVLCCAGVCFFLSDYLAISPISVLVSLFLLAFY